MEKDKRNINALEDISSFEVDTVKQKVLLSKLLLQKYGVLHQFHVEQLKRWPFAASKFVVGSYSSVDPNTCTVVYNLFTNSDFFRKEGTVYKRAKFSPLYFFNKLTFSLKKEKKMIEYILSKWTKDLFWGQKTKVIFNFNSMVEYEKMHNLEE